LIGGLRSDEDTWSGSKVNRVIGEFLGPASPIASAALAVPLVLLSLDLSPGQWEPLIPTLAAGY